MVQITALDKSYGSFRVLHGIDLEVAKEKSSSSSARPALVNLR
ncbi:hypothetical protein ACOJBO_00385 [Rhizobium beringeri]